MASEKDVPSEKPGDIVVISILKEAKCSECGTEMVNGDYLRMENNQPLCVECADLGDLVFLPSGDTALTRRSRKHSKLSAIVVRFSRARKRYERLGVLVEADALEKAEEECAGDEAQRAEKRGKAAVRREVLDQQYLIEFTKAVRAHYPKCPTDEAATIALHACEKYSGRVGRSAMAKELDREAVTLAVRAHVRHVHTDYDTLLGKGVARRDARARIADALDRKVDSWRG